MGEEFKSYKPVHTKEEVIQLTEFVLGRKVQSLDRQDLGEINAVYFIDMDNGQQCVVRISPKERNYNKFFAEAWAFKKCHEVGVPTPEVLAVDVSLSRFPEAFMITRRIKGISGSKAYSTEDEKLALLKQLGHYLSLIHKIKVKGFARHPEVQGDELVGKYSTLWESLKADLDSREEILIEQYLLPKEKIEKYKKMFEDNKELFDLKSASLVHGDMSLKNSIVDGSKIVGVVDMEDCMAYDPVQDFAWQHFFMEGNESYFSALKEGYDNKELFDGNFMKKLYLYQLYMAQSLLSYYYTRGNQEGMEFVKRRLSIIESELG